MWVRRELSDDRKLDRNSVKIRMMYDNRLTVVDEDIRAQQHNQIDFEWNTPSFVLIGTSIPLTIRLATECHECFDLLLCNLLTHHL